MGSRTVTVVMPETVSASTTTKCPPPPDHPIRHATGWPAASSVLRDATAATLPDTDSKCPTRLSARSRYQGTLHCAPEPFVQHVFWLCSASATSHWVQFFDSGA